MTSNTSAVVYLNLLFVALSILLEMIDWASDYDMAQPANMLWRGAATLGPISAIV